LLKDAVVKKHRRIQNYTQKGFQSDRTRNFLKGAKPGSPGCRSSPSGSRDLYCKWDPYAEATRNSLQFLTFSHTKFTT